MDTGRSDNICGVVGHVLGNTGDCTVTDLPKESWTGGVRLCVYPLVGKGAEEVPG